MSPETQEQIVLENYLNTLRAEGYEVVEGPDRNAIPSFLEGIRPDALAFGASANLVIEIAKPSSNISKRLRKLVSSQPGWELRIVGMVSAPKIASLEIVPVQTISGANNDIIAISSSGHPTAALLLAWASFEASARALIPEQFRRPQTPGRLVEILASRGIITPKEADKIRGLAEKRNQIIHGVLVTSVGNEEIEEFVRTLRSLEKKISARAQGGV